MFGSRYKIHTEGPIHLSVSPASCFCGVPGRMIEAVGETLPSSPRPGATACAGSGEAPGLVQSLLVGTRLCKARKTLRESSGPSLAPK